jgi:hypothetical protein
MKLYEGVSKSFRTGRLQRELQMVQLSASGCSCIAILWVSLVSFAIITLCVASEWVFIVVRVHFIMTQSGNFWIHDHTSTRPYVFMAWCLVKHRDNFTFLPEVSSRGLLGCDDVRWCGRLPNIQSTLLGILPHHYTASHPRRPRLGCRCILSSISGRGLKMTTHLHLVPRLRMRVATPPFPQYVFMVWYLLNAQKQL